MGSNTTSHSRIHLSPAACPSCGEKLPAAAQFCPGCGRGIKPLKGSKDTAEIGPRTDKPLTATSATETQVDIADLARFLPQRYKPLKKIGQGGMGAVYQCQDMALERAVAIKLMTDRYRADPHGERRFMREARAQAIVNHPNVATILNFGISPEGHPFLVMELLEGQDLRTLIRQEKVIEPLKALELLRQTSEGLNEAHLAGLVHRDLKPSNIMIIHDHRGQPWVKVLDLGLAKTVGGQTDLKSITMDTAGLLVGTPAYMSPEQVAGSPVDGRADLYALGVVLFEMLTGRLPFESETMEGWLYQHLHVKPQPPSQVNPNLVQWPVLDRLALWLMAKNPQDRPSNAGELAQICKRLIDKKLEVEELFPRPPARKSGPRPALAFEENPPARKSGPRASISNSTLPPPDMMRTISLRDEPTAPAPKPAAQPEEVEQRRNMYLQFSKLAEKSESERKWHSALEYWRQALPFADRAETVNARMQGCRREIEFEDELDRASKAADSGDWELAEKTLARLSSSRANDTRIEQVRARLPNRLISAWLRLAQEKVKTLPEGDLRQALLERLGIAYAQAGELSNAVAVLNDQSRKPEARVVGMAQAICAAIQNGFHEGLRPFLDQLWTAATSLTDPSERGRAQVEIGRALSAYGDRDGASGAFQSALTAFQEANSKGIPMQAVSRRNLVFGLRRSTDMRSISVTGTNLSGAKAIRASFEAALGAVAQGQAEAGLVDDSLSSTALIDDPWTLAQTLSQVSQAFARTGRIQEAEKVCGKISFAMPKTQALRALAVSRVYCGEMAAAEDIVKNISAPADRIAIQGLLAAAWALRNEKGRAQVRITEAIKNVNDVIGARARFQALLSGAEPLVNAGFHDIADPLVKDAAKLIDLMDDPAERLRCMLQLSQVLENARDQRLAATRTIMVAHQPSSEFIDALRRGLVVFRQVRNNIDRLDCAEKLAHSIAWGSAPELASEVISTCKDETDFAMVYVGLATGMA